MLLGSNVSEQFTAAMFYHEDESADFCETTGLIPL
jgi:hypothetical protein